MKTRQWTKPVMIVGTVFLVVILLRSGFFEALSFETLKSRRDELHEWTTQYHARAVLLYFALYVATTAVSLPGATMLTLAGGAAFGFLEGLIIVSFASTLGATLCFVGSRFLFRDWVRRKFRVAYEKARAGLDREGPLYLFSLRLIPAVPFFVINLVFGLTRMRPLTFFFVSQMGMLPGTMAYVNAGTQLGQVNSPSEILSARTLLAFALLGLMPWLGRGLARKLQAWRKRPI